LSRKKRKKDHIISIFRGHSERPSRLSISTSWQDDLCELLNPTPRFGRWSPIVWKKDERRISGAFDFCDFLVLDFDGGLSIESALERLSGQDFLILATKSHGVPQKKHSMVLDRFRVIIPFAERVRSLADFYATMRSAAEMFPEADQKCLDAARFYWTRGKGELGRGYGVKFEVKKGTALDEKKAFIETFGVDQSELNGFNLTRERICVIKVGGFGPIRFDFVDSRSMSSPSPNFSKRAKRPFRLGRRESPAHWWSPAKKPVFEKIKTINSLGKTIYRAGRFLREEWRGRGLLAFEINGKISKKLNYLRGVTTRHPGGHRLWVAYDVLDHDGRRDAPPTDLGENIGGGTLDASFKIEARIEIVKKNLTSLFESMGLSNSIKADSWDFGRKIPLVPSEIQKLIDFDFTGRFIHPGDDRIIKKIEALKIRPADSSATHQGEPNLEGPLSLSNDSSMSIDSSVSDNAIPSLESPGSSIMSKPIPSAPKCQSRPDRLTKVKAGGCGQQILSGEDLVDDLAHTSRISLSEAGPTPLLRRFWKSRRELDAILSHPKLCGEVSWEGSTLVVRSSPLRISSKKIVELITGTKVMEVGGNSPKIQSKERSVRRLINSLVDDGYFVTFDPFYIPGKRGRILSPTKKLFEELFHGGMLLDENMEMLTPIAGIEVILRLEESTPAELGEPTDGKFNEWVWRAAWKFPTRQDFFTWLHQNHGDFVSAKSDRERQAENAWKRRQTLTKKFR
jgi:hypothetical protein